MRQQLLQSLILKFIGPASYVMPKTMARIACDWFLTPPQITPPPAEAKFLETAKRKLQINGCPVWSFGEGNKKALVVHGWAGRGAQLRDLCQHLVARGFEVWTTDFPGHGQSGWSRSNLGKFQRHVLALSQELGGFEVAVGHSLGAAALVAAQADCAAIQKLIMIGMPSDIERVFRRFCERLKLGTAAREHFYQLVEAEVGRPRHELAPLDVAHRVTAKGLLIHDPKDPEVPIIHAEMLIAKWPKAQLVRLDEVGHYRILKSQKTFDAIANFV